MHLINAVLVGLKEIWANKFRSMLTMLGIVVAMVMYFRHKKWF